MIGAGVKFSLILNAMEVSDFQRSGIIIKSNTIKLQLKSTLDLNLRILSTSTTVQWEGKADKPEILGMWNIIKHSVVRQREIFKGPTVSQSLKGTAHVNETGPSFAISDGNEWRPQKADVCPSINKNSRFELLIFYILVLQGMTEKVLTTIHN